MKTKDITAAALGAAIITVFVLMACYLSQFTILGLLIATCSVVVLMVHVPLKPASLALIVATLLVFAFTDWMSAVMIGILFCILPGACIGIGLRYKLSFFSLWLLATGSFLLACMADCVLLAFLQQSTAANLLHLSLEQSFAFLEETYQTLLQGTKQLQPFLALLRQAKELVLLLIPAFLLCFSGGIALVVLLLSGAVLRRLRPPILALESFSQLHIPRQIGSAYLLFSLVELFTRSGTAFDGICLNIVFLFSFLLWIDGMSLCKYLLNRSKLPTVATYLLFFLSLPVGLLLTQVVLWIGLADSFWDFRTHRGVSS